MAIFVAMVNQNKLQRAMSLKTSLVDMPTNLHSITISMATIAISMAKAATMNKLKFDKLKKVVECLQF